MTHIPESWECDVCGERVSAPVMVTIYSHGGYELRKRNYGWLGHYHAGCWNTIRSAIGAIARPDPDPESPEALERIPVATVGQVFTARRTHRSESGEPIPLADPDLLAALEQVNAYRYALPRAGITSLRQVAAMTDEQLLEIEGVGQKMLRVLREATS